MALDVRTAPGSRVSELLPLLMDRRRVPPCFGAPVDGDACELPEDFPLQALSSRAPRPNPPNVSACRRDAWTLNGMENPCLDSSSGFLATTILQLRRIGRPMTSDRNLETYGTCG